MRQCKLKRKEKDDDTQNPQEVISLKACLAFKCVFIRRKYSQLLRKSFKLNYNRITALSVVPLNTGM